MGFLESTILFVKMFHVTFSGNTVTLSITRLTFERTDIIQCQAIYIFSENNRTGKRTDYDTPAVKLILYNSVISYNDTYVSTQVLVLKS